MAAYDVAAVRGRFATLRDSDRADGGPFFFDTPGGSQVPDTVRAAVERTLRDAAGNLGGRFATSRRIAEIVEQARADAARFLGCSADEVIFGQNMTTLNFALSRAMARTLQAGDEIVVTALDHDASVSPWLEIAADRGAVVRTARLTGPECTLDYDDLAAKIGPRTKVVAFSWAANSVGTVIDARRLCALARAAGALSWIDATHYAAHQAIDVEAIGADVLVCSPYKFCGPHLGLAYGRASVLGAWRPYKVRPAPTDPVGKRFETGTLPYEQLAGFSAAVDYWAEVDATGAGHAWTRTLAERFLAGLPPTVELIGTPALDHRVPTFLLRFPGSATAAADAEAICDALVARGFYVTASEHFYCLGLREAIGGKAVRIGLFHYNTAAEVDALLAALHELTA